MWEFVVWIQSYILNNNSLTGFQTTRSKTSSLIMVFVDSASPNHHVNVTITAQTKVLLITVIVLIKHVQSYLPQLLFTCQVVNFQIYV